jgi:antitoxin component YwqK of YwqJK toxin-antitoxin module
MKTFLYYFGIAIFIPLSSCGQQRKNDPFNKEHYKEIKRGEEDKYPYVVVFNNKLDTNYKLKTIYLDSTYQEILFENFFKNDIPEGPYFSYSGGKIYQSGYYKNGKHDGIRITYRKNKIIQKAYFNNGVKVGTWIEYGSNGEVIKKTVYDKK